MKRSPTRLDDGLRRLAVLATAIAQPVVTIGVFSGRGYGEILDPSTPQPPIVPASYAFMIWTAIFAGSLVYAIYQALPSQRTVPLLRAIGWPTASAFLATNLWLIAAAWQNVWLTFLCIVWIFGSLLLAFRLLTHADLTPVQHQFVLVPMSVFLGWVSVSLFANLGSAAKQSGWANVALGEAGWSMVLLACSGALVAALLRLGAGNRWYAGAAIWALVGIVVANLGGESPTAHPAVAATAGAVALGVLALLARHSLWEPSGGR